MTKAIVKRLIAAAISASAVTIAACAEEPTPPAASPSSAASARHPDTKAAPGDCNYYNYYHDESKNPGQPSACSSDCDCDGMRSCTAGTCQGEARPEVDCDSPKHRWNEAWNPMGAGKCEADCDCDGRRTCVWPPLKQRSAAKAGSCEGVAR